METGQKLKDRYVEVSPGGGEKKRLSQLCGPKGLILYFYPKDNTPGCTVEACDFRDKSSLLKKLGYSVVGVSGDSIRSHEKFSQKQSLNFPLISDEDRSLSIALGVWGEKKLYAKIVQAISRSTFVLDQKLKITKAYKNVRAKGHVERLLKDLNS